MKLKPFIMLMLLLVSFSSVSALTWEKTFTKDNLKYYIGADVFAASPLSFICTPISSVNVFPKPDTECWIAHANYKKDNHYFNLSSTKMLNAYMSAKLVNVEGYYFTLGDISDKSSYTMRYDWRYVMQFNLMSADFFDVSVPDTHLGTMRKPVNIEVLVDNKLGNDLKGGFKIMKKYALIQGQSDFDIVDVTFAQGKAYYPVTINSLYEGEVRVTIVPFITLDSDAGKFNIDNSNVGQIAIRIIPETEIMNGSISCLTDGDCRNGYYCNKDVDLCYKQNNVKIDDVQAKSEFTAPNLPLAIILIIFGIIALIILRHRR